MAYFIIELLQKYKQKYKKFLNTYKLNVLKNKVLQEKTQKLKKNISPVNYCLKKLS